MTINVVYVTNNPNEFQNKEKVAEKMFNEHKPFNKKEILKQIEQLEGEFKANLDKQQTLESKITSLNKELFGLMKFGKLKEKIAVLQGEITEKVIELNTFKQANFEMLNAINDLGSVRFILQEQERIAKEDEKKLRQLAIQAISKEQESIHNTYEKLEKLKMDLQNGHDFLEMVKNNELKMGDITIPLISEKKSNI